jgi:23S rRNA (adenine2503-C2)-methyltransferase
MALELLPAPKSGVRQHTKPTVVGLSTDEIAQLLQQLGHKAYRGRQVAAWVYGKGARSFADMTDLPVALREQLSEVAAVGRGDVLRESRSSDGTIKLLLRFADGEAVETVYLPYDGRDSVCISTQVGCPAACAFCATGLMGLRRNLTAGEMLDQVLLAQDVARREQGPNARITNVVFMGMGEPLLNLAPVVRAARLINSELGISMRNVTLSTVGITPAIRRLAQERLQLTLAVSLHAPEQRLREQIVPMARRYPLDELMAACHDYAEATSRRLTFEYVMLAGVNDSVQRARQLGELLRGELAHVNLIPFNPCPDIPHFSAPSLDQLERFRQEVERHGVRTTLRVTRGREIEAACGQLRRSVEQAGRTVLH